MCPDCWEDCDGHEEECNGDAVMTTPDYSVTPTFDYEECGCGDCFDCDM